MDSPEVRHRGVSTPTSHRRSLTSWWLSMINASLSLTTRCHSRSFRRTFDRTRSSADADKPARRVQRSIEVIKHGTNRYVRYGFLLVRYNKTLSLKRTVFATFDFEKRRDLQIRVKGHSRSSEPTPINPPPIISY